MTTQGPLVLVVEDEPQMLRFLRASLGSHGYRLVEATTANDGLAQATARGPDVVLLDLGLPDLDGLEVTRRMREVDANADHRALGARAGGRQIDALDAGADDYLTKPFSVGELLARIRVALRHAASAMSGREEPVFSSTSSASTSARGRSSSGLPRFISRRPSTGSSRRWSSTRARSSLTDSSSRRCGAPPTSSTRSISASSWDSSAKNSSPSRRNLGTSSMNQASDTA